MSALAAFLNRDERVANSSSRVVHKDTWCRAHKAILANLARTSVAREDLVAPSRVARKVVVVVSQVSLVVAVHSSNRVLAMCLQLQLHLQLNLHPLLQLLLHQHQAQRTSLPSWQQCRLSNRR
jgi:excinuclease UvrABC helicase subunit UvrB